MRVSLSLIDADIYFEKGYYFENEMSVVLQKVVNNQSHINTIAEELSHRFTVDGYVIKDNVDVIFLSRIIEGFSRNIASNDKVSFSAFVCICCELINELLTYFLSLVFTFSFSC